MADEFETVAFQLKLRNGQSDEYKRRHDEIWPEMQALLREVGVVAYEIWWEPDSNRLFAWMRRRREHRFPEIRQNAVWKRWQSHMADILEQDSDGVPIRKDLEFMFRLPSIAADQG